MSSSLFYLHQTCFELPSNCSCAKLFFIQKESPPIQFHVCVTKGHHLILFVPERWSLNCLHHEKTICLLMILELVVEMPIMCTKNNSRPKEVVNGTLGHVIGYQLPKNCNYTSPNHWWNLWVYNTCLIHITWNSFHKFAWPWPNFRSWTSTWHYWHAPNIGTRCIHQISKPKFHYFYWTNSHRPYLYSHRLTNAKD